MKKKLYNYLALGLTVLMLAGVASHTAYAQQAEHIERFNTEVSVQKDTSIVVKEAITYTFADGDQKHGIYRDIPISKSRISHFSVADESGNAYGYSLSGNGSSTSIKIGDADTLIEGTHTYVLMYTVSGAIGDFKDFDEIYWNATGNDWQFPINATSQKVILPGVVSKDALRISCYVGDKGSTNSCANAVSVSTTAATTEITFAPAANLAPLQGVTIAVGFPKGIVVQPTASQKFMNALYTSIPTVLALLLLVWTVFASITKWRKYAKDPKGAGVIIAQYDVPEKLSPVQVGALLHKSVRNSDISAEIILLAVKGFIKIEKVEKKGLFTSSDYQFTLLKDVSSADNASDDKILEGLFEGSAVGTTVLLSDLKKTMFKTVTQVKKEGLQSLVTKEYFVQNPDKVRVRAVLIGVAGLFVSIIIGSTVAALTGVVYVLPLLILSVAVCAISTYQQTARTKKGVEVKEYILGLAEYLQIAEKDRINFHNAPEKKPELFEALLPYAMVLGVEKAWAKEFEGVYVAPPTWYVDPNMRAFNTAMLVNSFSDFSSSTVRSFYAPSSSGSGGGGFSGGGGGGGGGGSW
jgi:uncharacterized membrane protein